MSDRSTRGLLNVLLATTFLMSNSLPVFAQAFSFSIPTSSSTGAPGVENESTQITFISPLIVPTDVSSWGGQHGESLGRTNMEGPPDLSAWLFHGQAKSVDRDPRYSFTGTWTYFDDVDIAVSKLQDKMPALAKVTGELKTPCGQISQSMPPVPDLPAPDALSKKPENNHVTLIHPWLKLGTGNIAVAPMTNQKIHFSRTVQAYSSQERVIVATPGSVAVPRSDDALVLKVGRAYVLNGSPSVNLEIESGRTKVILPPGGSGLFDTAANGLTQFSGLTAQAAVVDLCNPSIELARIAPGEFITVAHEDAIAEDLLAMHGIEERIDRIGRSEGYLLVQGRFSMEDAYNKDAVLQSASFATAPVLQEQKSKLLAASQANPWTKVEKALVTGIQNETSPDVSRGAAFMPTRGARYARLASNELGVSDGAVLVRGAISPVVISSEMNKGKIMTQVRNGAVVMVSALDGRYTVLNLTDAGPGSCEVVVPDKSGYKKLNVGMGQVAEVYINDGMEPSTTILAYRTLDKKGLPNGLGVALSQYDYLAAMKRFNLSFALPRQELKKVLKTMAATAYVMRGRTSK